MINRTTADLENALIAVLDMIEEEDFELSEEATEIVLDAWKVLDTEPLEVED